MAVAVEFLLLEPPVIVLLAVFVPDADPDLDADEVLEADALLLSSSSPSSSSSFEF